MNSFAHTVDGKPKPARRRTNGSLGYHYGPDSGRTLVVELVAGDLVRMRPSGTRHSVAVSVWDIYRFAMQCQAQAKAREKREAKKAAKLLR